MRLAICRRTSERLGADGLANFLAVDVQDHDKQGGDDRSNDKPHESESADAAEDGEEEQEWVYLRASRHEQRTQEIVDL